MDYEGYAQLRQPFVGTWTLVRSEFLNYDNRPLYPYGGEEKDKPPCGRLLYTDHNLFSAPMSASLHLHLRGMRQWIAAFRSRQARGGHRNSSGTHDVTGVRARVKLRSIP